MNLTHIEHLGIAVKSLEEAIPYYENVLGLKIKTDLGTMDAEIAIRKTGNDLMIGFNPKYLVDALRAIEDEEVTIYMSIPRSPCFIRDDKKTYNYMILPVNFNADAY